MGSSAIKKRAIKGAAFIIAMMMWLPAYAAGGQTPGASSGDSINDIEAMINGGQGAEAPPPAPASSSGTSQGQSGPLSVPTSSLKKVHVKGVKGDLYLTPQEYEFVKQKKQAIERYLYQQQQLRQLRNMLKDRTRKQDVQKSIRKRYPFSPQEIIKLRELQRKIERAKNSPIKNPKINIKTINLDINSPKPLVVHVAKGYASSLVFFDDTGAPWPIADHGVIGDKSAFGDHIVSADHNVAVFDIKKQFKESNALINLKGLAMPIVLQLDGMGNQVDSRVAVRLPENGPQAKSGPISYHSAPSVSSKTMDMLNGDYPPGSVRYEIKGAPATAMLYHGWLYVRTQANLLSPPPMDVVSSPTGYKVYKISPIANLLFSYGGKIHEATVGKAFGVKLQHEQSVFADNQNQ